MNAKPTRMLFAAVSLSALAAVLASSAQARTPEGNGTRPPSKLVVHALESSLFFFNVTATTEIYTALTSPTIAYEPQIQRAKKAFFVDPVYASLDPAIRIAIVARSHAAPLARGNGKHQLKQFPVGYRGLP